MSSDSSPFVEVQQDPDVCSNCFRRTHGRYERNYRLDVVQVEDEDGKQRWTVEPVEVSGVEIELPSGETELIGGMEDDVFRYPHETTKIPEKGAPRGMRTICECGFRYSPELEWKNRPLKKRTFFEYADRIAERLRENGVGFDEDAFFDELDALKSDPDEQFADDKMFSKAAKHASTVETVRNRAAASDD